MIKKFEDKGEMKVEVLGEDGNIKKAPRNDWPGYWRASPIVPRCFPVLVFGHVLLH
jgi:hypothetical protein